VLFLFSGHLSTGINNPLWINKRHLQHLDLHFLGMDKSKISKGFSDSEEYFVW
jgi:hypothetical protein